MQLSTTSKAFIVIGAIGLILGFTVDPYWFVIPFTFFILAWAVG